MEKKCITTKPEWWYPYAITVPIGLFMFAWIALSESPSEPVSGKPSLQQHSQGSSSPNIMGDHNVVTINPDNKGKPAETANSKEAFHIDLKVIWQNSVFVDGNKLVAYLVVGRNNVAWPIYYSISVEIVNLQNVAAKIKGYSLQAASNESGPWTPLAPIHAESGEFYWIETHEAVHSEIVVFEKDLEKILGERPIDPRETRLGWGLFGFCRDTPRDIKFFKFIIRDTAGARTETIIPLNREMVKGEVTYDPAVYKPTRQYKDLSKFEFKHERPC